MDEEDKVKLRQMAAALQKYVDGDDTETNFSVIIFDMRRMAGDYEYGWLPGDAELGMFRPLTEAECVQFRAAANAEYEVGTEINPMWHPVYRDECEMMNARVA